VTLVASGATPSTRMPVVVGGEKALTTSLPAKSRMVMPAPSVKAPLTSIPSVSRSLATTV
jgi:hypothetical protein